MKNVIICSNCQIENPIYMLTCRECKSFLRTKIPNIDLWSTFAKLLESPIKAAELIIQSEHKNFVLTLLVLASFKLSINVWIISNLFHLSDQSALSLFSLFTLGAAVSLTSLIIMTLLITVFNSFIGLKNRFIDNISIYAYSFLPIILIFFILSPIELALFGEYWFTFNPSPIIIKTLPTYILLIIEGLFLFWSCFLLICSTYAQSRNKNYSLFVGSILFSVQMIVTYFGFSIAL